MNFDVIKTILPNSSYDLDNLKRKYGEKLAEKRLFGSLTKLIKILSYNDEGAIIMERKKKEKRIAGFNNIINKCKKIKKKQENKINKLEGKIKEINLEPDYIDVPDPVIQESKLVIVGVPVETHNLVLTELNEAKKQLSSLSLKLMVKEHLQLSTTKLETEKVPEKSSMENDSHEMPVSGDVIKTQMVDEGCGNTNIDVCEIGVMTEPSHHSHGGDCKDCVEYSNKIRRERFGDERTAVQVMTALNKHNFMQPNKYETILLVKKAMLDVKNNIKHKFSVFLSIKMVELCDLLLFAFNQMEKLRQHEVETIRLKLSELK